MNILEAHEMKFGFYFASFVQQSSKTEGPVSVEAIRQLYSTNTPVNKEINEASHQNRQKY